MNEIVYKPNMLKIEENESKNERLKKSLRKSKTLFRKRVTKVVKDVIAYVEEHLRNNAEIRKKIIEEEIQIQQDGSGGSVDAQEKKEMLGRITDQICSLSKKRSYVFELKKLFRQCIREGLRKERDTSKKDLYENPLLDFIVDAKLTDPCRDDFAELTLRKLKFETKMAELRAIAKKACLNLGMIAASGGSLSVVELVPEIGRRVSPIVPQKLKDYCKDLIGIHWKGNVRDREWRNTYFEEKRSVVLELYSETMKKELNRCFDLFVDTILKIFKNDLLSLKTSRNERRELEEKIFLAEERIYRIFRRLYYKVEKGEALGDGKNSDVYNVSSIIGFGKCRTRKKVWVRQNPLVVKEMNFDLNLLTQSPPNDCEKKEYDQWIENKSKTMYSLRDAHIQLTLDDRNIKKGLLMISNGENTISAIQTRSNYTLSDIISKDSFSLRDRLECCVQVARGFVYLHKRKMFHRDLKPDNIFIDFDKEGLNRCFKIADFSYTKSLSITGFSFVGNEAFSDLEAILQGDAYGLESDIFMFGRLMYCLWEKKKLPYDQWGLLSKEILLGLVRFKMKYDNDLFVNDGVEEFCYKEYMKLMKLCVAKELREGKEAEEVLRFLEKIVGVFDGKIDV